MKAPERLHRLNVLLIFLPPLRERREDIAELVDHFLTRFNTENGKQVRITGRALQAMLEYSWPGNVRELVNAIERLVVLASRNLVLPEDLPLAITALPRDPGNGCRPSEGKPAGGTRPRGLECRAVLDTLEKTDGVQARAAELLGITPRQIRYRGRKCNIARRYGPEA